MIISQKISILDRFKKITFSKIYIRLWKYLALTLLRDTWIYFFLYKSYWNSLLNNTINKKKHINYMSINVNPGAGIGHQLANYNASIWFAKKFNLIHAHTCFPNKIWEKTIGFNSSIIGSKYLINKNYKKVKLPLFDEKNNIEISKIKKIINSYSNIKVIFFLELDQIYKKQYETIDYLKKKYYVSKRRKNDKIIFNKKNKNIALHIRLPMQIENVEKRYNDINYKTKIIKQSFNMLNDCLKLIKTKKKIQIYIFTQFKDKDLNIFNRFKNIEYCYNINPYKSFVNLIKADILITSRSSFSYKAALFSEGVKISPLNFWHGYPKNDIKWLLAKTDGKLIKNKKKVFIK